MIREIIIFKMFIKSFQNLTKSDVAIAGGKGASLGEMLTAGIPVPPGFVVLAPAFDKFLDETDLTQEVQARLAAVNYADVNSVDNVARIIHGLIARADFPDDLAELIFAEYKRLKLGRVAVRSSATAEDSQTASWAGELESYLNVEKESLLESIKKCWASLFTPRAIVYRHEKGLLKTKVSVAVVVQKMVEAEVAGVSFTVHPVTKDKDQMIHEAVWGLGEALVGGSVTPDAYVVRKGKGQSAPNHALRLGSGQAKVVRDCFACARNDSSHRSQRGKLKNQNPNDFEIVDINVSEQDKMIVRGSKGGSSWKAVPKSLRTKQKLTEKQIGELSAICVAIEKHYKFPCDIEWAMEKGKFYIVQARPITTL